MEYEIGSVAVLRGVFTVGETQTTVDPTTVKIFVRNPHGVEVSHEYGVLGSGVVKEAVGRYRFDLALTIAGGASCGCSGWYYRWVGYDALGVPMAADEATLDVAKSKFRAPY